MSGDPSFPSGELVVNTQLGTYRIEERLGAGGMGVVYRATDTKLGRSVALKVVRAEFMHDAGLARFKREARVLASLNHPHIAAIHGMEESGGTQFLVLEYVPGPTLADRLQRGPLPMQEAVLAAKQIAEALEAAHAKGIIHRDLKPANIKINPEGKVKVLDFGLAKSMRHSPSVPADGPTVTISQDLTNEMTIVGTAAYMSPEQATGKELDTRADIWAFGCVLYEALSGKRPFRGKTLTEILAAVVAREPDWQALPADTRASVSMLLRRCLRKDPASRLRDIGDARIELEDALSAPAPTTAKQAGITRRTAISGLTGAAAGAAATGVFAILRWPRGVPRSLTRFAITAPEPGVFAASANARIAISPDGTRVAFNSSVPGAQAFYVRSLAELESKRVKEVPSGGAPFFSPDSRWVGFIEPGNFQLVRKLPLTGGAPVSLCPTDSFCGATWSDTDTIYLVDHNPGGLMSIPAAGGKPTQVAGIDFTAGERMHKFPCALPGGKVVLLTITKAETTTFDDALIVALVPGTGRKKVLLEGGTHPRYSSGYLLYARDGKIMAVRFDPKRLEITGQPFTALDGLLMSRNTGVANYDVSASGDLAYVSGICDGGARTLVWVDRNGKAEAVPLAAKSYLHPRLSPDDRRLAIEVEGPSHDLYVYDFDRGVLANITTDGVSHWPVWSPDGTQLAYRSGPMGHFTLWRVPADRSRAPEQVPAMGIMQNAESWSPDGRTIAFTASNPPPAGPGSMVPMSILVAHMDGGRAPESFSKEKAAEGSPKFSPDGGWLAYCSNESGKPQVYVQAYPGPGAKIQISGDGGTDPVWKRNGGELFYRNGDSMIAVTISTAPTFKVGRPQELWRGHYSHGMSSSCGPPGATSSNYDVTADGQRFLMVKDEDQDRAASKQIVVALGWAGELSRVAQQA